MSRRHRRSVTSARRHLATAIGSAALGSLSSTAAEVPVQSKDDEPYPRALLHSFSLGHRNRCLPGQRRGERRWQGRVDLGTGSRTPEITNRETDDVAADHYHRYGAGRSDYQGFRAKPYRLSIGWPPPRNLNDRSARPRKTRPPNSCPTSLARWLRDYREDARGSVCKGAAAAMGDAGS
jgi:hypothetical protein